MTVSRVNRGRLLQGLLLALLLFGASEILAINPCEDPPPTPVVVSLGNGGFHFVAAEAGVYFDLDANGVAERTAWTDPAHDNAFLVLDRNRNGRVDDGRELFGSATEQPSSDDPNGFRALAVFDHPEEGGNADGYLSPADGVYPRLRLWLDRNQDGESQSDELSVLSAWGVEAIDLEYRILSRRDRHGNLVRWMSDLYQEDRKRPGRVADVIFASGSG
jgi:hypothetical protein